MMRSQIRAAAKVIMSEMKLFESMGLPNALRAGGDVRVFADLFVHGHIAERFPQNAVVDGPRAQPNAVGGCWLTERGAAIQ